MLVYLILVGNNSTKNATKYFTKTPRTLFLVDSLGAALTTFFLFIVMRNFYDYFGMPKHILSYLSLVALVFCIYSTTCFFLLKGNWTPFIRVISIANLIYCVLTMVFLYVYFNNLTKLGLTYFFIEIVIVITLVYVELNVAAAVKKLK